MSKLSKKQIINYAILALPLSFVGLPIYVNISDFYAREFGLSLAIIGYILFFARFFDLIQDPIIGYISDFLVKRKISRQKIIYFSAIFLSVSFFLLFNPPNNFSEFFYILWFLFFLSFTYLFFNFIFINFESIAVLIAKNREQRITINSAKEFCGLLGILLASATPAILFSLFEESSRKSYFYLSLIFIILTFFSLIFFFRKVKFAEKILQNKSNFFLNLKEIFANKTYRNFLLIFLINSIAVSIPASIVTFYVADILQLNSSYLGVFLAIYFFSGAAFIYLWQNLAKKYGKINIWIIAILGSVITFIFAYFLDANSASFFYVISFFSGVFLGADLIIPPAIIADLIHDKQNKISSYFSFFSMMVKSGLMIASSASLISLSNFGYEPGNYDQNSLFMLPVIYALIPSILKLLVIFLLLKYRRNNNEKI